MELVSDKKECCGCTACLSVCNHQAITMKPDPLGFVYPVINSSLCVDCGLCLEVCAFQKGFDFKDNLTQPTAYAVRHKNMREIETSRSGAMFIAISDYILDSGGVVYGVGYKDGFKVCHKRVETKADRNEFKGSKYVQSDLSGIFPEIKRDLKKGLPVLFSGTPCQTAGLISYLKRKNTQNLYVVDIVCHGVPSPYIFRDYLAYTEKKHNKKIVKIDFRDKSLGWNTHVESFILEDGSKIVSDTFSYLFQHNLMLRTSCGNCKYTNLTRPSDITIADFWGWEKTDKNFNSDNKGCSLTLINTDKGIFIWENVKHMLDYIPARLEDCLQYNLMHPTKLNNKTRSFEADYQRSGIDYVIKHYGKNSLGSKIKNKLKKAFIFIKQ